MFSKYSVKTTSPLFNNFTTPTCNLSAFDKVTSTDDIIFRLKNQIIDIIQEIEKYDDYKYYTYITVLNNTLCQLNQCHNLQPITDIGGNIMFS